MEAWLAWARGPLFWAALAFMVLGLVRHAAVTLWEIRRVMRRAGDKVVPYRQVLVATLKWLFPVSKAANRVLFSLTTLVFHVSILIVPIFLAGHIVLWQRGMGLSWPAIGNGLADVLTVLAVVTALALVVQRAVSPAGRALSRFQDYALPPVVALPFVFGFLLMHPAMNPFSYATTLLLHVLTADLVLILIPITKISHCILLPTTQWVSEVAWHWPPDAGSRVGLALGKENEPI